ncbi:MAG: type II secretion system protein [Deltaproteobacteria bacterium]|nr:type II secretion system protein [Deltaproteobacteria bacterium]
MERFFSPQKKINTRLLPVGFIRGEKGITYLATIFAIAIISISLTATGSIWSTMAKKEREKELLFIGEQYKKAIASYYKWGRVYPRTLKDLLKDPRTPAVRRHIRKLYLDPMTGEADWVLVRETEVKDKKGRKIARRSKGGGKVFIGVRSKSTKEPLKVGGFKKEFEDFEGASKYSEWEFIFEPNKGSNPNIKK